MNSLLTEIKKVADQIRGVTYGADDAIDKPQNGYIGLLRANNIQNNCLNFDDLLYVPSHKVSSLQILKRGDILIAASSGSLSIVGKAGVFKSDEKYTFGAFCKAIRPRTNIDASYLSHYFFTTEYRTIISSLAAGANINNLRNEHIDNLSIPLPPLAEQQRIAALLDTAYRIQKQRESAIAKIDQLAQSVFVDMFGDPKSTKRWDRKEISKVAKIYTGKTPSTADGSNFNGDVPFVTPTDLRGVIKKSTRKISQKGADAITLVRSGSTLVGCIGDVGRVGYVEMPVTFNQQINAVDWNNELINDIYGFHVLCYMEDVFKNKSVSAVVPILNKTNFSCVDIPVPPLIEQMKFNKFINSLWSLKSKMVSSCEINLISSIQHQSFQ